MPRSLSLLLPALAAAALAGCASAPAPAPAAPPPAAAPAPAAPPPPTCDAGGAQFAVGQALSPQLESAVRHRAKAELLRTIKPGQAVTMDLNPSRVNVELDARNRVKAVRCG